MWWWESQQRPKFRMYVVPGRGAGRVVMGVATAAEVPKPAATGYTYRPHETRIRNVSEALVTELDTCGLQCPMPLLKARRALNELATGERLRVLATDQGSVRDFRVFAEQSGHLLLSSDEENGVYIHLLEKVEV